MTESADVSVKKGRVSVKMSIVVSTLGLVLSGMGTIAWNDHNRLAAVESKASTLTDNMVEFKNEMFWMRRDQQDYMRWQGVPIRTPAPASTQPN